LANILYFDRFESVFEAVEKGLCRYGVLPIENSLAGSVTQVYDLMGKYHFSVVRGMYQRIDHALLAKPGVKLSEIRQVYSHPQGLSQCSAYLRAHPEMEAIPCANTAVAAKKVANSEDPTMAAIASRVCAELYGLSVVDGSVANDENNHTPSFASARRWRSTRIPTRSAFPSPFRTSRARSTADEQVRCHGTELTKLESRPIPGRDFEFCFHIDWKLRFSIPSGQPLGRNRADRGTLPVPGLLAGGLR
jgi:chorismate mutase/prephenate dehydratase